MARAGTVAVTGAAGLLGSAVVAELTGAGHAVIAIDRLAAPAPDGGRFVEDDLSDPGRLEAVFAEAGSVVHCAALAHLGLAREDILFNANVLSASNVILAAEAAGVARLVFASSQSALGFAYAAEIIAPDRLPVDEAHPCRPREGYALSKLVGEQLCDLVARRSSIVTLALRFPVIWTAPRFAEHVAKRLGNPAQAAKSQWAYVDARDAARACRLALDAAATGPHALYNIAAPWPFEMTDPEAALKSAYGDVPHRSGWQPGAAVFDSTRALNDLGFRAEWRWTRDGIARDTA